MSIYFDFKTINELTGDNYHRQPKEFTLDELLQYTGRNGNPTYVAIEGIVYDISNSATWGRGTYFGLIAGQDLTNQFNSYHEIMDILSNAPKVGILIDEDDINDWNYMSDMNNMNWQYDIYPERQVNQDKSKFMPDDWIRYITPLVTYALREPSQGMNMQNLYQRVILMGVLVGLGKTPQEAINQIRDWQNTGASQILKGGTSTGAGGTAGIGTGGMGGSTGSGIGTTGGMGTGGTAGTGIGTGGMGGSTGSGIGTTGGMGTGGTTGTGFGTGGMGGSTGSGAGTTGGMGTGGTAGTGFGTGEMGGSTSTSGSTGARSRTNTSNRLYFD